MVDYWYQDGGALLVHPDSLHLLVTGGQAPGTLDRSFYVSVSHTRGDTWTRYKLSDEHPGFCHALAVAPSNTSVLYAAGEVDGYGMVYRSDDLGASWYRTGGAPQDTVRDIRVHPANPAVVYAAADRLFRTTDGGVEWDLMDIPVAEPGIRTVRFHPHGPDTVVAAGDSGVFVSVDGGANWSRMNDGLECPAVNWLEFADDGNWLVAATAGRACFTWSLNTGISGRLPVEPAGVPGPTFVRAGALDNPAARAGLFDACGRRVTTGRAAGGVLFRVEDGRPKSRIVVVR